jgi:hypothetical protein
MIEADDNMADCGPAAPVKIAISNASDTDVSRERYIEGGREALHLASD